MPSIPQSIAKPAKLVAADVRFVFTAIILAAVVLLSGLRMVWADLSGHTAAYALVCSGLALGALAFIGWQSWAAAQKQAHDHLLHTTLSQLKAIWDNAPLSIVLFDPHDPKVPVKIVDCNPQACEMHGYTREELIGCSIDIIESVPWTHNEPNWITQFRREHRLEGESEHKRKDGTRFWIEYFTSLLIQSPEILSPTAFRSQGTPVSAPDLYAHSSPPADTSPRTPGDTSAPIRCAAYAHIDFPSPRAFQIKL